MNDVNYMIDGKLVECVETEPGGYDIYVDGGDDPINLGEIWWRDITPNWHEVAEYIRTIE